MLFSSTVQLWALQLSTTIIILRSFDVKCRSNCCSQPRKMSDVIHAFLFAVYSTGRLLTFLKQRGLSAFPTTSSGKRSVPVILAARSTVILCLHFLPPMHASPLKVTVLSGRALKNRAVSSALNTSRGSYAAMCSSSFTFLHSVVTLSSTLAFSPHTLLKTSSCLSRNLANHPSDALNDSMFIIAAYFSPCAMMRGPLKGRCALRQSVIHRSKASSSWG